ncbi:MAG: NfeD family protein [Nibricoccus sp.]
MTAVIIWFLVGIVLLALEIVVPGAILGIAGGIAMLVGVFVSFGTFGGAGGAIATIVALLALGATLYLEFVWLPKSRLVKSLVAEANADVTSQTALANESDVIGREAVAQTVLAPSGYVSVGGKRYEAYSQSGHATAGERLRVVGLDNFRLIVTKT